MTKWSEHELISDPLAQITTSAIERDRAVTAVTQRTYTRIDVLCEFFHELEKAYVNEQPPAPVLHIVRRMMADNAGNMEFLRQNFPNIMATLNEIDSYSDN